MLALVVVGNQTQTNFYKTLIHYYKNIVICLVYFQIMSAKHSCWIYNVDEHIEKPNITFQRWWKALKILNQNKSNKCLPCNIQKTADGWNHFNKNKFFFCKFTGNKSENSFGKTIAAVTNWNWREGGGGREEEVKIIFHYVKSKTLHQKSDFELWSVSFEVPVNIKIMIRKENYFEFQWCVPWCHHRYFHNNKSQLLVGPLTC